MCDDSVVDEYDHPLPSVLYTPWNIPGPGVDKEEFESQLMTGCDCSSGNCNSESACTCVLRFGPNYYESGYLLETKFDGPIIECNSLCACFGLGKCNNRMVQFGPAKHLQVFIPNNTGKGFALKCNKDINQGTFVCEYAGEVIGVGEAKKRLDLNGGMNFVFVVNEHLYDGRLVRTCIDPTTIGNIGRYINHSCDPNCIVVPVRIDSPVPKLCIFACKTIPAGEEITFHYGGGMCERGGNLPTKDCKTCLCGSVKCIKYLPFNSDL